MIETLNTEGFLFTETTGEWALVSADFGDGYESGLRFGSGEGTRSWSVKLDVLPGDSQGGSISESLGFLLTEAGGFLLTEAGGRIILEQTLTLAEYLWHFFRVSKAAGNQPFWIEVEDPSDGARKLFLASFADNRLSYGMLCARIYSTGLQLRQRRLPGVVSPVLVT